MNSASKILFPDRIPQEIYVKWIKELSPIITYCYNQGKWGVLTREAFFSIAEGKNGIDFRLQKSSHHLKVGSPMV